MAETYTDQELVSLKKEHAPTASKEQFDLWMAECRNRGAAPVRDIFLQIRSVKEWDPVAKTKAFKNKAIYGTTIGFLRTIAKRSGDYAGQLPSIWIYLNDAGDPIVESKVPLKNKNPYAAQASVLRKGWDHPVIVVARWDAYAQSYKDSEGNAKLNPTWSTRGPEQLEKCAEALALRKAFPEDCGNLYLPEEINEVKEEVTELTPKKRTVKPATDNRATENERKSHTGKLREYANIVGQEELKTYILNKFNLTDIRLATEAQWQELMGLLAACPDNESLKELIGGQHEEL